MSPWSGCEISSLELKPVPGSKTDLFANDEAAMGGKLAIVFDTVLSL